MQATSAIDGLLGRFILVAVPVLLVCASVLLVVTQPRQFSMTESVGSAFKVLPDPQQALSAAAAIELVQRTPSQWLLDTQRAEHRFWLWIPLDFDAPHPVIEFPSRHLQRIGCYDAGSMRPLGRADRAAASGAFREARAGFALHLTPASVSADALLCEAWFTGPASLSVLVDGAKPLAKLEQRFYLTAGFLEGGLLILVFFTLVMAAVNRESRFVVLTVWLVCNLRLASLTLGWDTQWLGYRIPPDLVVPLRQLTIATYFLATVVLFHQYFRGELTRIGFGWMLQSAKVGGIILFLLALVLPFSSFLPVMWVITTLGISLGLFLLIAILLYHPSRSVTYFSLAMGFALLAIFAEVLAAAFGWKFLLVVFNSISAAWASSVLVTLSLAEQMRTERSERVRAQNALNRTYESAPIGLFTMDAEGRLLRANPMMRQILDLSDRVSRAGRMSDWFDNFDLAAIQRIASAQGGGETELHRNADGQEHARRWFLTKVVQVGMQIEGSLQDITDRIEATEKLRYLANHDSLTGLLNRRGITLALDAAVQWAGRGKPASLLFIDLNRFKLVNDLYRNQTGDYILKEVAKRITAELPPKARLGRLGDDQYLAVIEGMAAAEAEAWCDQIAIAINTRPYHFGSQILQIDASMGLVDITVNMTTSIAISTAQRASEEAKQSSRALVIYDADAAVHKERLEELHLIKLLGADRLPKGLHLYMQPIMSMRAPAESLNFEVLLRYRDIGGRMVPVYQVLNAAVASGNMARLDKWVLTETLTWLLTNHAHLGNTRFVAVNLSGTSLNDQAFLEDVIEILNKYESVVHYLCLEITEGVALNDLVYTNLFIDKLKECGATIALDDFGAGYTSFSYLRNLRADALKIDGAFVRSIHNHPANVAIVASIVELSHNLGMRCIAEGVEDPDMLQVLAEIGVDYVQGYVITRPQPLDTATAAASAASYITESKVTVLVEKLAEMRRQLDIEAPEDGTLYH